MKKLVTLIGITLLLAGCSTTGKLIATSSTTVDHAMRAWAVHVVDGKASAAQEETVKAAKLKYDAAEDQAVAAYTTFTDTGNVAVWKAAKVYLLQQQQNLINLIEQFTGKTSL